MTAAVPRSDRRRSIVTLAVWSVGFLAVMAVAAWQFGWLPSDEAVHTPPADAHQELTGGSAVPFDDSVPGGADPWSEARGDSTAAVDPAIFEQQTEPEPPPNPTNEMTNRDDRRGRLWNHVRETPTTGNTEPPPDAAPRYSTAAEPAGWLADEHPGMAADSHHASSAAADHAARRTDPQRYDAHAAGIAPRPEQFGREPMYQRDPRRHAEREDYGAATPSQDPRVTHAQDFRAHTDLPPAGAYAQRGPDAAHLPHAGPSAPPSHVRLVGVEEIDTAGPAAVTADGQAGLDIDPGHPAALDLAEIDHLVAGGDVEDVKEAHRRLSTMYWKQPDWRPVLQKRIDQTAESIYFSNLRHYMEPYMVQPGDHLSRIAARYKVSWQYLERLNSVPATRIRPGQRLKVIKGPFAARVDLSDYELTIHAHGWYVRRYRIGIGRDGSTPVGTFTVQEKLTNPTYYRPPAEGGGIVAADDPQNPLGEYWISIGNSYGIHGTIEPDSIGRAESRGCIRLVNEDVAEVYDFLVPGSEVVIQP